jgi:predicted amidophosphoribosyltransferase
VPEVRFRKVDETTRQDHYYLQPDDECYFLYEYTAHAGWQHATNQLIFNLKKKLGAGGYHYKAPAIARCAAEFTPAINDAWLASAAFVPVPPSKAKGDPLYDDRMVQVCRKLNAPKGVNVREVIEQITSTDSVHEGNRLSPQQLKANYRFNDQLAAGMSKNVAVVDDLLTTGSHFRAVKEMILERIPDARVAGFFVARRAIPSPFAAVSVEDLLK